MRNKEYLKGEIAWPSHLPGHWIGFFISFDSYVSNLWKYKVHVADSLKVERQVQVANVIAFLKSAIQHFYPETFLADKPVEEHFEFQTIDYWDDAFSVPKQLDNSTCGVHVAINTYFFFKYGRMATNDDYLANKRFMVKIKRFMLYTLLEAHDSQIRQVPFAGQQQARQADIIGLDLDEEDEEGGESPDYMASGEENPQEALDFRAEMKKVLRLSKAEFAKENADALGAINVDVICLDAK